MNFKTVLMTAVVAMMVGACASSAKKADCACGAKHSEKASCASGECPMTKDSGCADCHKSEEKSGK